MPKPFVPCCTPQSAHVPSGWAWVHAYDCPASPGQKIRVAPNDRPKLVLVTGGVRWGAPEDVPERLDPSAAHPACIAAAADGATPCSRCSWLLDRDDEGSRYIDHWMDRA